MTEIPETNAANAPAEDDIAAAKRLTAAYETIRAEMGKAIVGRKSSGRFFFFMCAQLSSRRRSRCPRWGTHTGKTPTYHAPSAWHGS